jgi:protein-S-isoprenylcysteine O-methyltransferase Ste14
MAGAYRIVRHPMYLGYLIGQLGFLLVNFSTRNLIVELGVYLALWLRIRREEAVLQFSEEYRQYQSRVRWRLVPYIF